MAALKRAVLLLLLSLYTAFAAGPFVWAAMLSLRTHDLKSLAAYWRLIPDEERAQPRLVMSVGLLTSTAQFRTVPVSSIASNFRKQCGLAQIQSVTVPFSVTSLLVSKLAVPWWAATGAVIRAMSTKMNTAREHLAFTEASLAIGDRLTASAASGLASRNRDTNDDSRNERVRFETWEILFP